jgi:hypothetical protein
VLAAVKPPEPALPPLLVVLPALVLPPVAWYPASEVVAIPPLGEVLASGPGAPPVGFVVVPPLAEMVVGVPAAPPLCEAPPDPTGPPVPPLLPLLLSEVQPQTSKLARTAQSSRIRASNLLCLSGHDIVACSNDIVAVRHSGCTDD